MTVSDSTSHTNTQLQQFDQNMGKYYNYNYYCSYAWIALQLFERIQIKPTPQVFRVSAFQKEYPLDVSEYAATSSVSSRRKNPAPGGVSDWSI
jgi:hypothetical protein